MDKPKRPPPNIGQRPPKKKPAADVEMGGDEPAKPAKKMPPLSSAKPKTVATSSKAPSAPVINDEDLGSGLSKEEAIEKVEEFFGAALAKKFEDAKW